MTDVVQAPLGSVAEWATVGIAIVAVVASLIAVSTSRRSEKRQLYTQIHQLLTDPDAQKGRRILFTLGSDRDIERLLDRRGEDFDLVNRAVGLYNTLGLYYQRGYVPRDAVRENWEGAMRAGWTDIERFARWRRGHHAETTAADPGKWHHLFWLAREFGILEQPPR